MIRTVAEAALTPNVLAGPDRRDWSALPRPGIDYTIGLEVGVRGLPLLASVDLGHARVDPEVRAALGRAFSVLADLGTEYRRGG